MDSTQLVIIVLLSLTLLVMLYAIHRTQYIMECFANHPYFTPSQGQDAYARQLDTASWVAPCDSMPSDHSNKRTPIAAYQKGGPAAIGCPMSTR